MINSLLDYQKVQGHLPVWTLWDKETYCMIANHAVPVVVDAYLKGFKGFSPEDAYNYGRIGIPDIRIRLR